MKKIFLICCFIFLMPLCAKADVIYLKNGDSKKGMVVEEYVDRVVFSTVDGEVVIIKELIDKIQYDDPEINLMSLGDKAFDKGFYKQAYKYYVLAFEINPELEMIREKLDQTGLLVFKEKETTRRDMVEKKAMLESESEPAFEKIDPEKAIKEKLDIILARSRDGSFRIEALSADSPFRKAGFKTGDNIISVWSRLAGYLTLKELSQLLLAEDQHIIKLTLKRNLKFQKAESAPLGAKFAMKWEGMTVGSVDPGGVLGEAGLKEGDLLTAVNGENIRYMKMDDVITELNQIGEIDITIHRKATVFRTS